MFRDLINIYYNNKAKIITAIIIIALVIIVIQILNNITKRNNQKENQNIVNASRNTVDYSNLSTKENSYIKNTSAITGEKISEEKAKVVNNTINTFLEYCNNGKTNLAYEMLTDECKEVYYENEQSFINNYYSKIFSGNNIFTVENWFSDTYRVKIKTNTLSTGNTDSNYFQDYITISNNKLNINSYVGRQNINKTTTNNNVGITVLYKDVYMEYEQYCMNVTNKSGSTIILDDLTETTGTYLIDNKNIKYNSYSHELYREGLIVQNGFSKKINVKFKKNYTTNSNFIDGIVFSKMKMNYKKTSEEEYIFSVDI